LNNKESEILNLQQKINDILKNGEGKDETLEKLKAEFAKEREDLNNKLEDLKKRFDFIEN
jgi:predicted  nucleic acid-binding Zn-ribbon protein